MKNGTKSKLIILSLCILGVLLAGAVALRLAPPSPEAEGMGANMSPGPSAEDRAVNPDPDGKTEVTPEATPAPTSTAAPEIVVSIQTPPPSPPESTDAGKDAVSTGTEQTIQADVVKPTPPPPPEGTVSDDADEHEKPADPVLQNPDVTPPPATPAPKPVQPSEPQSGDKKDGQIYIPGFGWIDDHGGGGEGTVAEDMYENGNKIGSMG